ncbi:MAG: glycosyltransferase [Butyrivibrio sp.]|nr:glycosyltransferase [Ruminococcus flavefaciens]MCM1561205.1 glycosyltransferase [Butyrivibrio sp.]
MIYSIYHQTYWIKGGTESAMAYRVRMFRNLGVAVKFIFTNSFSGYNIWDELRKLGFRDSEVLWMYGFFSDCRPSPVTYTLEKLEKTIDSGYVLSNRGNAVVYQFPDKNIYYTAYLMEGSNNRVYSVDMISNACLVRRDYYTYCKVYSEYYIPMDGQAKLYLRRYFHEDGSIACEEMIDGDTASYKFPDKLLYSREELAEYMMSGLHITEKDIVLIDGVDARGVIDRAAFIQSAFPAKTGFIFHTNYFLQSDEEHVLWSSAFEYVLSHPEKVHFYVTNTDVQSGILREQFRYYKNQEVRVETIPAAFLDKMRIPEKARKKNSIVTAGRLSGDKRVNWIIEAVVIARQEIPDLTLDIYGEGYEENMLRELIQKLDCSSYVSLCGFQKLDEIYQNYEAYVSASCGETLGITLLEALGSGLPIIGFDLPYGMQTLVDEGQNGYRITDISAKGLADGIIRLFKEPDFESFRRNSYKKAEAYLMEQIEKKWEALLC